MRACVCRRCRTSGASSAWVKSLGRQPRPGPATLPPPGRTWAASGSMLEKLQWARMPSRAWVDTSAWLHQKSSAPRLSSPASVSALPAGERRPGAQRGAHRSCRVGQRPDAVEAAVLADAQRRLPRHHRVCVPKVDSCAVVHRCVCPRVACRVQARAGRLSVAATVPAQRRPWRAASAACSCCKARHTGITTPPCPSLTHEEAPQVDGLLIRVLPVAPQDGISQLRHVCGRGMARSRRRGSAPTSQAPKSARHKQACLSTAPQTPRLRSPRRSLTVTRIALAAQPEVVAAVLGETVQPAQQKLPGVGGGALVPCLHSGGAGGRATAAEPLSQRTCVEKVTQPHTILGHTMAQRTSCSGCGAQMRSRSPTRASAEVFE